MILTQKANKKKELFVLVLRLNVKKGVGLSLPSGITAGMCNEANLGSDSFVFLN